MSTPRVELNGTHGGDERRPYVIKCSTFGKEEREKQNLMDRRQMYKIECLFWFSRCNRVHDRI
jgi:hypothetical protein